MHILLWLSVLVAADVKAPVASNEVTIQSVTRLLPRAEPDELRAGDLLVLDLDNTVFREVQWLGTDDWYMRAHAAVTALGYDAKSASDHLESLNRAIKNASEMRLMEPEMPKWISNLQDRGVVVLGLTARNPGLARITLDRLRGLGIDFGRRALLPSFAGRHLAVANGVAFTDGAHKGRVLGALLERARFRPGRVLAVDDRIHHVHSLVEVLLEAGIPGQVIHYLRAEEEDYDERAAAHQQHYFEVTGHVLTDEEARRQCALFL